MIGVPPGALLGRLLGLREIKRAVDQRHVRKGLWKIAQHLS
jgi:hypothetical protein